MPLARVVLPASSLFVPGSWATLNGNPVGEAAQSVRDVEAVLAGPLRGPRAARATARSRTLVGEREQRADLHPRGAGGERGAQPCSGVPSPPASQNGQAERLDLGQVGLVALAVDRLAELVAPASVPRGGALWPPAAGALDDEAVEPARLDSRAR